MRSASPDLRSDDIRATLQQLRNEQERLFLQLQSGEKHFRHLARSVWRIQEDERRRLARDIHDGIGQHLTALLHRLERLRDGDQAAHLEQAIKLCEVAIYETRSLSRLLRPQILDDLGLGAALAWLARATRESSELEFELDLDDLPPDLDSEVATLLFRIVQEALNNVVKHARAHSVLISINQHNGQLNLHVVDDGVGCDVEAAVAKSGAGLSTGLASMRERVQLFGGRFAFTAQPGEGAQIRVTLPNVGKGPAA